MNDLRFAIRQLLKNPGFATVVVLTLGLGIGANTAIFSVFKATVLEPLPYPDPFRLVHVWKSDMAIRDHMPLSGPDYFDLREQNRCFEELGAYTTTWHNLGGEQPTRIQGILCTAAILRAFGVQPALGRWFTEAEEQEGTRRVVVLSHRLWKERYGSDASLVGRMVVVNGEAHTVVGIAPANFQFLSPWYRGNPFEVWTPLVLSRDEKERNGCYYLGLGRMKSDLPMRASYTRAQAELRTIGQRVAALHPNTHHRKVFWAVPLLVQCVGGSILSRLLLLFFIAGCVLLVACANVAAMLLAKGADRQAEVAVRFALGASQGRIIRQWLVESLLLALIGGLIGTGLAHGGMGLLRDMIPADLPRKDGIRMDQWVLLFSLGLSGLTAVICGLAPALTVSRTQPIEVLKGGGLSGGYGGQSRRRLLPKLAVAQLAIAVCLANLAVLMSLSYQRVLDLPQGFDDEGVLTADVYLWGNRYQEPEQKVRFWRQLLERVEALPGVDAAAVSTKLPLEGGRNGEILVAGEVFGAEAKHPLVEMSWVTPRYFQAIGIPLLAGRTMNPGPVAGGIQEVVVNRALVERYWPGQGGVGQSLRPNSIDPEWSAVIVGVVDNVRQWGAEHRPLPEIYFSYDAAPTVGAKLVVHSFVDPVLLVFTLQQEILRLDADMPLSNVRTMKQVLLSSAAHRKYVTHLIGLFMGITLVLAFVGVHGVITYQTVQRTREFGLRRAFGASRLDIHRLVLRQASRIAGWGILFGLVGTLDLAFLLRHWVYGVNPLDALALVLAAVVVAVATLFAGYLPARRAAEADPIVALRCE
ncbi:MAG: ABC transporter permease [Verrucomicrobiia bacterium]